MTLASDNKFPKILITEGVAPSSPSAGDFKLFVDSSDHLLKMKNSAGVVTTFGSGMANPMTTAGDMIVGGASGTPTRVAAGSTAGHIWTSNGSGVAPSWQAAPGGGGVTQAWAGYNTVGASTETAGFNAQYFCKSVTLANDCLITSIGAYLNSGAGSARGPAVALYDDNSSAPGKFLGGTTYVPIVTLSGGARWIDMPLGKWVAAGTYWLVVRLADTGGAVLPTIAYDSGSDRKTTATGTDGTFPDSISTSAASRSYSIRANTIR